MDLAALVTPAVIGGSVTVLIGVGASINSRLLKLERSQLTETQVEDIISRAMEVINVKLENNTATCLKTHQALDKVRDDMEQRVRALERR